MWKSLAHRAEARAVVLLALTAGAATAFALMSANLLGPADRGAVVVMTTTASFLMIVGSLGVATGVRVLISGPDAVALASFRSHAARLTLAHVLTSATVGVVVIRAGGAGSDPWVSACFVLYAVTQIASYLGREALHGLGSHARAILGDFVASVAQVGGLVALALSGKVDLRSVSLLLVLGGLCQLVYLILCLRRERQTQGAQPMSFREVVRFSYPAMLTALGQAVAIRGDRLVLGVISGSAAVGIYGAAATLTEAIWLIPGGVAQVVFKDASTTQAVQSSARARHVALVLTLVACVLLALAAAPVVNLLLGPDYAAAIPIVYVLIAASVPMASYQLDVAVLNGLGRLKEASRITLAGMTVLILGCLALIPAHGAMGAAIASVVSYALMAVTARWRVRQRALGAP